MKISIVTATYNREKFLTKLYHSLVQNNGNGINIEWIISDDGSTDETAKLIEKYKEENKIDILYYKQKNQGKMTAINNVIKYVNGEYVIECDSDDYFEKNAFIEIKKLIDNNKDKIDDEKIGSLCFLKYDQNGNNMGDLFLKEKTTMFDLYFKEGETGEKAILFKTEVRKKYKYKIEETERFSTEARMYHEIDKKYNMICFNKCIMICEYQDNGYTKNIKKQFIENPYNYYEYFKEMFDMDMKNIKIKKRLYIIKHYILFSVLTNNKNNYKNIKGFFNKFIYIICLIPGIILSKKYKKSK